MVNYKLPFIIYVFFRYFNININFNNILYIIPFFHFILFFNFFHRFSGGKIKHNIEQRVLHTFERRATVHTGQNNDNFNFNSKHKV